VKVDLPIEEAIRPPWIWDGYSNLKIGETYMQFFGTNSITDVEGYTSDELVTTYEGADTYRALEEAAEGVVWGEQKEQDDKKGVTGRTQGGREQDKNRKNTPQESGDQRTEVGKKVRADAILAMESDRTIESSIDYLVRIYSFIKHHSLDVGEFLRNYTWRPIATLPQILGSSNFSIAEKTKLELSGSLSGPGPLLTEKTVEGEYVISGLEGFHSRAFGDVADLFGLVDPKVKKILGLTKEKTHATAKKLDVRAKRRDAIWNYVQQLTDSKGLLG
jgi:hypothetical protein